MQTGLHGIAAPVGVGNLRYRPPGRGARSRTAQDKHRDVVSVKDYKGITVNDTGAFVAALAAITLSAALYIPAGTYTLDSGKIAKTLTGSQSLKIYGDGADATILYFPNNGDGLNFTFTENQFAWIGGNNLIVEDVSFVTNVQNTGSAIKIDGNCTIGNPNRPTILNRVGFRGTLTSNSCWGVGLHVVDLQNVEANDCYYFGSVLGVVGKGIFYTGTSDTEHPTVLSVHNWQQQFGEIGVHMTGFVEGLMVTQSNYTQTNYGLLVDTTGSLPMFSTTASQYNCNLVCIQLTDCSACQINGNLLFANADNATIIVANNPLHSIVGNVLVSNAANCNGIILQSGATDCLIESNIFDNFVTNIWLQSGANNNVVGANRYNDGTPILDQGTGNIYGPKFEVGMGGVVTQITSKATGVTLSKPTGQITMHNASLAANTTVTFTLTNTFISATDQIICEHISGGTLFNHSVRAVAGAGSAVIHVRNITAGALTDALVLKFTVIKSVNS